MTKKSNGSSFIQRVSVGEMKQFGRAVKMIFELVIWCVNADDPLASDILQSIVYLMYF